MSGYPTNRELARLIAPKLKCCPNSEISSVIAALTK
jgi:hypothetical protein